MNGRQARKLRNVAKGILLSQKVHLGEGYREYNVAMNSTQMVKDVVDGHHVVKAEKAPGTITSAWRFRVLYRLLKREYVAKWRKEPLNEYSDGTGPGVVPAGAGS